MNLSMVFLVLTVFIAYLLYDMFKKSRQQQELAQAQATSKPSQKRRLRPTYQNQCSILHTLHEQKMEALKHKQISLHLEEQNVIADFTETARNQVKNIMQQFVRSHNVYLLVCRRKMVRNQLIEVIREAGAIELGFETTEGAVAVLRQLSCTTHLEGNLTLCNIILQYLPVVWLSSPSKVENAYNFKSELDMVTNLDLSLKRKKEAKEE